jgi:hypothetical protein
VQTLTKYFCKSPAETKTSSSWTAEGRVPSPRGLVEQDETIKETGKKRRPERQQVNCQFQREEKQCYWDKIQQQNITRSRTRSNSNIKSNSLGQQRHSLRSGRLQQVLDREGQAPTPFGLVSLQIKKSADSKQTEVQIKN